MRRYEIEVAEGDAGYAARVYWDTEYPGHQESSLKVFRVAEELLLWMHEELIGPASPDTIKTTIRITKKGASIGGAR